jgi:hypothetical protein
MAIDATWIGLILMTLASMIYFGAGIVHFNGHDIYIPLYIAGGAFWMSGQWMAIKGYADFTVSYDEKIRSLERQIALKTQDMTTTDTRRRR